MLTAVGALLTRAGNQVPEKSELRSELREVCEITQSALDKVRSLSQALHPVMLEETGLESTLGWYLPVVERQAGIRVFYEKSGEPGDFDRDGDVDLLITTNNGPAYLYRNDQTVKNRSVRFRLIGTQSNRDAIGAALKIFDGASIQSRLVKGGSSYLSQSELPVTFGLGKWDRIDRLVIEWHSGRTEEYKNLTAGRSYDCVGSKGINAQPGF
jgi:hypothetical protein